MPPKADKLQQNIDSIKSFLLRKSGVYPELNKLMEDIKNLEKILSQKKLTLQIVGNNEILNQAIFDLISSQPEFAQAYNIKYDPIPKANTQQKSEVKTILTLQRLIADSTESIEEYSLEVDKTYIIGRALDNPISLDGELYQGVSWQHLEIKAIPGKNQDEYEWHIKDLNSSNGTFINGEQIKTPYILKPNDQITLGNPQFKAKIACLKFTQEVVVSEDDEASNYQDVIDCDLLLIIVVDSKKITKEEKSFLKTLDTSFMSKQFLIIDISDEEIKNNQTEIITSWETNLEKLKLKYKLDVFPVLLKPYYEEDYNEELPKAEQKIQDKFIKAIANVIKRQPENILAKRLSVKLTPLITPLQDILSEEEKELKVKIKKLQDKLTAITSKNWKDISKGALVNVKDDKDKFFKQIKSDLAQAKSAMLDNFSKRSIVSQIQEFVDDLEPTVFKKQGQFFVKLSSNQQDQNANINEVLVKFSTSTIENWALKEWEKINNSYGKGGLNELLKRLYSYINIIPDLFNQSPFLVPDELDVKNNFQISFMPIESEVRIKQTSMGGYIMKTLRANMMQVMMMATMVLGLVGLRAGKNVIFAKLAEIFKSYPILLGVVVFLIIFMLTNAYNQENALKLEEAGEKLKKEVSSYYQSLNKNLIEKVMQDTTLALEYEANRIDSGLERVQEAYDEYILETEKQQIQVKANLQALKEKEKNLSKEITEFAKLIR